MEELSSPCKIKVLVQFFLNLIILTNSDFGFYPSKNKQQKDVVSSVFRYQDIDT